MAKRRPSGDGMVRKREDGRWEGRIVVGHKENGEPIFRYVLAKTQKELLAIVDFFANIHDFSFPVRNTLLLVKAEKNTANCHAFLCFDALYDLYDLFP